ncbi:MAG: 50S ribosomal protein L20 [Verrucomicrobia bacterium]|nr:50S ribosomal protein L20 [Verrucomicrobiota bacterium]
MPRATNAPASRARRKRMLKKAKGFRGNRSKLFRYAKDAVVHGQVYAFRDRKAKKRSYRGLWAIRLNAACRAQSFTYSKLINGLKRAKIALNRKVLADIAVRDAGAFSQIVKLAQEALKAAPAAA